MTEYNPKVESEVNGFVVGEKNTIYNYYFYSKEATVASVESGESVAAKARQETEKRKKQQKHNNKNKKQYRKTIFLSLVSVIAIATSGALIDYSVQMSKLKAKEAKSTNMLKKTITELTVQTDAVQKAKSEQSLNLPQNAKNSIQNIRP